MGFTNSNVVTLGSGILRDLFPPNAPTPCPPPPRTPPGTVDPLPSSSGILGDLFPGVELPAIDYDDITAALTQNAIKVGQIHH